MSFHGFRAGSWQPIGSQHLLSRAWGFAANSFEGCWFRRVRGAEFLHSMQAQIPRGGDLLAGNRQTHEKQGLPHILSLRGRFDMRASI